MNQLFIILEREIIVKVKSKTFYFFVFLSPVLFLIPIIANMFNETTVISNKNLIGINSSQQIIQDTIDYKGLKIFSVKSPILKNKKVLGTLDITDNDLTNYNSKSPLKFHINEEDLLISKGKIKDLEHFINQELLYKKMAKLAVVDTISYQLSNLKDVYPIINQNSVEKFKKLATSLAFVLSMLMYITFILFNNSILKSVVEEKTNKLAEVLSIFVKPINIMAGKIVGQGLASLLQLILWIVVFLLYIKGLSLIERHYLSHNNTAGNLGYLQSSLEELKNLPLINIVVYLPLFFILGFLLNGALTTIIAVYSSSKNSNYLMFLGNIANMLAIYFGVFAATNPESKVTKISYFIPFVSYLTIPTTLPFNLSTETIITSLIILIVSVCGLFYMSAITYRKSIQ